MGTLGKIQNYFINSVVEVLNDGKFDAIYEWTAEAGGHPSTARGRTMHSSALQTATHSTNCQHHLENQELI